MVRGLAGFAGVFVLFMIGMRVIGFLVGGLIGIVFQLAWFAFLGWLIFTAIRVLSPSTADTIRDTFRRKPDAA